SLVARRADAEGKRRGRRSVAVDGVLRAGEDAARDRRAPAEGDGARRPLARRQGGARQARRRPGRRELRGARRSPRARPREVDRRREGREYQERLAALQSGRISTLRHLIGPPWVPWAPPNAYCRPNGPSACFASCALEVCTPLSRTVNCEPLAVIS